ncbi:MAG TPA: hypothetical protein VKU41_25165 [Polyangiaceae bacterium]|nr:hypothetical protein [Polyangiaceae bacterium]
MNCAQSRCASNSAPTAPRAAKIKLLVAAWPASKPKRCPSRPSPTAPATAATALRTRPDTPRRNGQVQAAMLAPSPMAIQDRSVSTEVIMA